MKLIHLKKDKTWLYGSPDYRVLVSEFSVALAAASKGKRCVQGVKICGSALYTERGRHGELPWDLNYSSLFYNIFNSIVLTPMT